MRVTVLPSRTDDTPIAMVDGLLCLFERGTPVPEVGSEVEVMISRVIYPRAQNDYLDMSRAKCLIVRSDLDRWEKVHYGGFETSGSMCMTSSEARVYNSNMRLHTVTPGRVGVYEANNVNANWQKGLYKLQPGTGWVDMNPPARRGSTRQSPPRLVGVESLDALHVFATPVFRPNWKLFTDLDQVSITIDGTIHFGRSIHLKQLTAECTEPGTRELRSHGYTGFVLLHGSEGHCAYVDSGLDMNELLDRNGLRIVYKDEVQ